MQRDLNDGDSTELHFVFTSKVILVSLENECSS